MQNRNLSLSLISSLVFSTAIAACSSSSRPEIDASRLSDQSSIELRIAVSENAAVKSSVYTRREGAANGAEDAVFDYLDDGFYDPIGILAAPLFIPLAAVIGGLTGAATGTSHTNEEIDRAIETLGRTFRPEQFRSEIEASIERQLRREQNPDGGPCISTSSGNAGCPREAAGSVLNFRFSFQLATSSTGGSAGALDFVGYVTTWTDPKGQIRPACISFEYREHAGNLFDLARDNGAPLKQAFHAMIPRLVEGLTAVLFDSIHTPASRGQLPSANYGDRKRPVSRTSNRNLSVVYATDYDLYCALSISGT